MGYDNGIVEEDESIIKAWFFGFWEALSNLFPHIDYAEDEQGDPQDVLTSLLDQIEAEVGDFFQPEGKNSFRSWMYSREEISTTCFRCNITRTKQDNDTLFRKFEIKWGAKAEQKMDALMKTIITRRNVPDYECASEECLGKGKAKTSDNVMGTPKCIFFLTGIVKPVTNKPGEKRTRKAMNFKMKLEETIIIENTSYFLRSVVGHIGDNKHLVTKTEQSGHYVFYRRVSNLWHCFNDDEVFAVDLSKVGKVFENENVYMLGYQKINV